MPSTFTSTPLFLSILAFRLVNSLTLATFFQPDEFFQSLEVFLHWTTWEWNEGLRSVAYPYLFSQAYDLVNLLGSSVSPATRAELLYITPKLIGALTAAVGDLYTYKLARKLWGRDIGNDALVLSLGSAFHWFCWTRTFTNSLETTITIVALYYWPWDLQHDKAKKTNKAASRLWGQRWEYRSALALAAAACTMRPTNALVWLALGMMLLAQLDGVDKKAMAVGEAVVVGGIVFTINAVLDYLYYKELIFPPYRFLKFNVLQSLSHFYGTSPWHYYLFQSLPILLIGYLPITLSTLYTSLQQPWFTTPVQLSSMAVFVITGFSLIAHKEVRFVYPLLPAIHVLVAAVGRPKRWMLYAMIGLNIPVAFYASCIHQRGVIDVVNWLRAEDVNPTAGFTYSGQGERVGFLMPCHSTPWSSHMQLALVKERVDSVTYGWALTCEPPIGLDVAARRTYLDEADVFYANQTKFLVDNFPMVPASENSDEQEGGDEKAYLWPDRLIVFEQALPEVGGYLKVGEGGSYYECKRFFNSHFHDDWRRKGDIVVLCLGG